MVGFELITSSVNKNYDITSKKPSQSPKNCFMLYYCKKGAHYSSMTSQGIIAYLDLEEEHTEIRGPE
jgi:hypothetical protein